MTADYPKILDQLGLGSPVSLTGISGGCIADARVARFEDGTEVFVKTHAGYQDMFQREAEGLRALAEAQAIRIPDVLAVNSSALVLEMIRPASRKTGFAESFGQRFARLHQFRGPACGFEHDNYIGATQQRNDPVKERWQSAKDDTGLDWPEFFIERRLRFQAELAAERGYGHDLTRLLDRAESTLDELLRSAIEPPVILHGDLWSGNVIVDDRGEACLIDPAVYFGHREADLAMTRLFGGFEPAFYRAYDEALPLAPGYRERLPMYQLYHVINHLNLFGGGYGEQARRILQAYT